MKRTMTTVVGLAAVAVLAFNGSDHARAQVAGARSAALFQGHPSAVVQVRGRGWHGGGHRGWRGGGRRGWRGGGWRGGWYGPGAGFAAGLILGGALAAPRYYGYPVYRYPRYRYYDAGIAYCLRRFKSYDPYTMTYLGYDGRRHPCP